MNQSEKPKFEEQWQRAFESAAETPPPSAWDAIEKRLDGEEAAVVPLLWWKNPKVWYAAAAVAALLLVSWPILRLSEQEAGMQATQATAKVPATPDPAAAKGTFEAEISSSEPTASAKNPIKVPAASLPSAANEPAEQVAVSAERPADSSLPPSPVSIGEDSRGTLASSPSVADAAKSTRAFELEQTEFKSKKVPANPASQVNALTPRTPTVITITQTTRRIPAGAEAANNLDRVIMGSSTVPLRTPALTQAIAALSPVESTRKLAVQLSQPSIDNNLEVAQVAKPKRSRVREFWAGLGIMPAAFNPRVNVTSAPAAFTNANASRQSLANSSRARLSYAVQAQAGKQLSKHWSVETGVSYLRGNSTFESDGYVLDAVTSQSTNVLEDALFFNATASNRYNTQSFADLSKSAAYIDLDQRTSNDYRYVQLPVQAGYTLNPDGKLNYTVLGGVVANLFLQNEIKTGAGYAYTNTADDGLYRALNWSAATGVRVNYRLGDHWNASLTGSYQKAIASILKGDGVLDSRPQLYGMAWGVRYVF